MSVVVVDSGVANLASVIAALRRLDVEAVVTAEANIIRAASHVILPGVGAAGPAMSQLKARGLVPVLQGLKQPLLGICLGMQLLFTSSDEGEENFACLDIIKGAVRQLTSHSGLTIPHMGWNQLDLQQPEHQLLKDIKPGDYAYFVHSFAAPPGSYTLASTDYGDTFTAVAAQGNVMGCQFHPERSGAVGSRILRNFLDL